MNETVEATMDEGNNDEKCLVDNYSGTGATTGYTGYSEGEIMSSVVQPPIGYDGEPGVVPPGRENTGRWTKEEHSLFLKGIEMHGKEWKKVAAVVKTRTTMQTRTHAQKYFEKLNNINKQMAGKTEGETAKVSISNRPVATSPGTPKKKKIVPPAVMPLVKDAPKPPSSSANTTPFPTPNPAASGGKFTEKDIFLPITEATSTRPANQEYLDIMKANCFLFQSLTTPEQFWFARNLCHFITSVRGRRWVSYHPYSGYGGQPQYHVLENPFNIIAAEFRMDAVKVAARNFHPFWLLGEHGQGEFCHRTVDGSWKTVTIAQVKEILKGEGPKNLLLLPPNVEIRDAPTPPPTEDSIVPKHDGDEDHHHVMEQEHHPQTENTSVDVKQHMQMVVVDDEEATKAIVEEAVEAAVEAAEKAEAEEAAKVMEVVTEVTNAMEAAAAVATTAAIMETEHLVDGTTEHQQEEIKEVSVQEAEDVATKDEEENATNEGEVIETMPMNIEDEGKVEEVVTETTPVEESKEEVVEEAKEKSTPKKRKLPIQRQPEESSAPALRRGARRNVKK
jgi:SHAQKYF class myb-like DNA-binding protein